MSDKKKTITVYQRLNAAKQALDAILANIAASNIDSDELLALAAKLQNARDLMNQAMDGTGLVTKDQITNNATAIVNALHTYQAAYNGLSRQEQKRQAAMMEAVTTAANIYTVQGVGTAAQLAHLVDLSNREMQSYHNDQGAELLSSFTREYSMSGHKRSIQEIMFLNVSQSNPDTVFDTLIWLGQTEAMLRSHNHVSEEVLANNPFHQQYVRLLNDLNNAPEDVQLKYVRMLNRQTIMNQDRVAAEYVNLFAAQADPKAALQQTDTFRHAQAFRMMLGSITGPMGMLLRQSQKAAPGTNEAQLNTIDDYRPEVTALLEEPLSQENRTLQGQRALADAENTYLNVPFASESYDLLNQIRTDAGERSDTCTAMYRYFGIFARHDHANIRNEDRYLNALTACERAARLYLKTHWSRPVSQQGKDRVRYAKKILEICQRARNTYNEKVRNQDRAERNALAQKENKSLDELERLARLQRTAGTAGINPQVRDVNPPESWGRRALNSIRHFATDVLTGLSHLTIGNVTNTAGVLVAGYTYGIKVPAAKQRAGEPKSLDQVRVPGERDANLQETYSNEVDPRTGILTDVRRVPMLWEQPVPDDPNQPPTISFRACQAKFNDSLSQSDSGTGHSFICVQYSKVDPRTGKLQRYQTAFGFYPKGGFNRYGDNLAQMQLDHKIPGQLTNDANRAFSVEKTVVATSQQINKLLQFAQDYEKDGYNMVTRNCTTFMAEAANAVGVDLDLREVDFTSTQSYTHIGSIIAPMAGVGLIDANFKLNLANKLTRDDFSYQRFGQKMVSKEDFERETHETMNLRMRGYTPGAAGQAIRANPGTTIQNRDVNLEVDANIEAKDHLRIIFNNKEGHQEEVQRYNLQKYDNVNAFRNNNYPMFSAYTLRRQAYLLTHTLPDLVRGRITDQASFDQALDDLTSYCNTATEAIFQAVKNAQADGEHVKENTERCIRMTKEFSESMDRFFRVTFQSDAALSESFHRIVTVATALQQTMEEKYPALVDQEQAKDVLYRKNVSELRDTASIVNSFLTGEPFEVKSKGANPMTGKHSLMGLLAVGRVYKNVADFAKDQKIAAGQGGRVTKSQRTVATKRLGVVGEFMRSYKNFAFQTKFNNSDLNLIFNTMPAQKNYSEAAAQTDSARMLQCLALEHVFGGLLPSLGADLEQRIAQTQTPWPLDEAAQHMQAEEARLKEEVKALPEKDPQRVQLMKQGQANHKHLKEYMALKTQEHHRELSQQFYDDAGSRLVQGLNEKLRGLSRDQMTYLRTMQVCIAQRKYRQDLEQNPDLAPDNKDYAQLAAKELMDTLVTTYCGNLMNGVMKRLGGPKMENMPSLDASLPRKTMLQNLEMPAFLNAPINGLIRGNAAPRLNAQQPAPAQQAPANPALNAPAMN